MDFQVEAMIGYVHRYPVINSWTFNGTESGWSITQTITIPATSTSPSTSPNPTEQSGAHSAIPQLGLDWMEISLFTTLAIIVVLLVVIVFMHKKKQAAV